MIKNNLHKKEILIMKKMKKLVCYALLFTFLFTGTSSLKANTNVDMPTPLCDLEPEYQ